MINQFIQTILHFFIWLISTISNLIFAPILVPLTNLFRTALNWDDISTTSFYTFFNDYVFKGIHFCTRAFINLTGFNENLLGVAIGLILLLFSFAIGLHGVNAIINIWTFFRKGKD